MTRLTSWEEKASPVELHRVVAAEVAGRARITVNEVFLKHHRLAK
jgi:hypothetical protein